MVCGRKTFVNHLGIKLQKRREERRQKKKKNRPNQGGSNLVHQGKKGKGVSQGQTIKTQNIGKKKQNGAVNHSNDTNGFQITSSNSDRLARLQEFVNQEAGKMEQVKKSKKPVSTSKSPSEPDKKVNLIKNKQKLLSLQKGQEDDAKEINKMAKLLGLRSMQKKKVAPVFADDFGDIIADIEEGTMSRAEEYSEKDRPKKSVWQVSDSEDSSEFDSEDDIEFEYSEDGESKPVNIAKVKEKNGKISNSQHLLDRDERLCDNLPNGSVQESESDGNLYEADESSNSSVEDDSEDLIDLGSENDEYSEEERRKGGFFLDDEAEETGEEESDERELIHDDTKDYELAFEGGSSFVSNGALDDIDQYSSNSDDDTDLEGFIVDDSHVDHVNEEDDLLEKADAILMAREKKMKKRKRQRIVNVDSADSESEFESVKRKITSDSEKDISMEEGRGRKKRKLQIVSDSDMESVVSPPLKKSKQFLNETEKFNVNVKENSTLNNEFESKVNENKDESLPYGPTSAQKSKKRKNDVLQPADNINCIPEKNDLMVCEGGMNVNGQLLPKKKKKKKRKSKGNQDTGGITQENSLSTESLVLDANENLSFSKAKEEKEPTTAMSSSTCPSLLAQNSNMNCKAGMNDNGQPLPKKKKKKKKRKSKGNQDTGITQENSVLTEAPVLAANENLSSPKAKEEKEPNAAMSSSTCPSLLDQNSNMNCKEADDVGSQSLPKKKRKKKKKKLESNDKIENGESDKQNLVGETPEQNNNVEDSNDFQEDIYGRLRDKEGNVVKQDNKVSGKYIPPALRKLQALGVSQKKKEELAMLKRNLKGLINRLAESNLAGIASQIEGLYFKHSQNDMNDCLSQLLFESLVLPTMAPERLVQEHILLIAVLSANVGNQVGAHILTDFVNKLNEKMEEKQPEIECKEYDNIMLVISSLFNFRVVAARLIYDILQKLADKFSEKEVELILMVLRTVGFPLRKEEPLMLKTFITQIQNQAAQHQASNSANYTRVAFMLEVINSIKNNNPSKVPNYDPTHVEDLKKLMKGLIHKGKTLTPLYVTLSDILKSGSQGRWWIVGSAWCGGLKENNPLPEEPVSRPKKSACMEDEFSDCFKKKAAQLKLLRPPRINIMYIITEGSEDYLDAFDKLLQLKLPPNQEKDMFSVILLCCQKGKTYNEFFSYLASRMCKFNKKYSRHLQFVLWDKFKEIENCKPREVENIGKFLVHLIGDGALNITVLKNLSFLEAEERTIDLLKIVMKELILHPSGSDKVIEIFSKISRQQELNFFSQSLRVFITKFLVSKKKKEKPQYKLMNDRCQEVLEVLSSRGGVTL